MRREQIDELARTTFDGREFQMSTDAMASWTDAVDPGGYSTEEFSFERDDQRLVTGALWRPDEPVYTETLMAFGHGASGDRYQLPIPYLAHRFARAGITAVSMDGPVHGLRQIGPGGRDALGEEMRRESFVDDMVDDWDAAIELVQSHMEMEIDRFGYFGLSMGSIFGIPMLAGRARSEKVTTAATLGLLGTTGAVARMRDRLMADAALIRCPTFFIMQLEDELFPRDGYLELFDAFDSKDKRLHANPGLHPEVTQEEIDFTLQFMLSHLTA